MIKILLIFCSLFMLIGGSMLPVQAENMGSITLDFTHFNEKLTGINQLDRPVYGTKITEDSLNFTSLNIKIARVEEGYELICLESNLTHLENISINLEPGTYKVYMQLKGDDTVLEYNNDGAGYIVSPQTNIVIQAYPPYTEGYILDAPWRIEKSVSKIPILAIDTGVNWADIYNISVYDHNDGDRFVASTNWTSTQPIDSTNTPFFYLFQIDKNKFLQVDGKVSIIIKFYLHWSPINWEGPVNVQISSDDIPKIADWYSGDTHQHTNYTYNAVEFGAPIYATKAANNALGLDWMIVTDHSFDMNPDKWKVSIADCDNHSDAVFRVLQGEEVSCYLVGTDISPSLYQYNHLLVYGADFIPGGEWEDGTGSDYTPEEAIAIAKSEDGITYPAHPFDDDPFRDPWMNYSLDFDGLQIWNHASSDNLVKLGLGINKWVDLLLDGRRVFIEGGSDAHGDFNTHAGRVKTYIYVPGYNQSALPLRKEILNALREGHSVMTNGPLVVFDINDEVIGNSLNLTKGKAATLHIRWNSTPEFGYLNDIIVKKGIINETNETDTIFYLETTGKDNFSGEYKITIAPNKSSYYRIEAVSKSAGGETYECFTNPIWVDVVNDTTAPEVTITVPLDGSIVNVSNVTIIGYAADDVGIMSVCYGVAHEVGGGDGGCNRLLNASTNFSINWPVSLEEGANTITVTATDAANNSANASIVVIRDTTTPEVTITAPLNGSIVNVSNVTVTGYATDDVGIVSLCYGVAHAGGASGGCGRLLNASTNFSINWTVSLAEGENFITITAIDVANNTANNSVIVIYLQPDEEPPASILDLTHTCGPTWINWTWTNPIDADFNYTMVYLNETWQANTSQPFYNATELIPDTWYEIATRTVDKTGNINGTWVNQTAKTLPLPDEEPPAAPIISSSTHPNENLTYCNPSPVFSWTTPSDPSGIACYSYTLDHLALTTPNETCDTTGTMISYNNLTSDTWYFHVRAKDNANNWGPAAHYKVQIENCDTYDGCYDYETGCEERNYYCNDTSCTYSYSNRHIDVYDDWVYYCSGDTVRKNRLFYDFYCERGTCTDHTSWVDDQLVENCNDYDMWNDTGATRWVDDPSDQSKEKEQKEQEYHDYTCSNGSCSYTVTDTQWIDTGNIRDKTAEGFFDTRSSANPYPIIAGQHNGTIRLNEPITVRKLYTYPCPGTGGHTEYAAIAYPNGTLLAEAQWNGYTGDWHNLTFNNSFTLYANETYNYTIRTGSYPQTIHATSYNATGGVITCSEFVDTNGKRHEGWIPAIKLW
jgi:hypothetical protein